MLLYLILLFNFVLVKCNPAVVFDEMALAYLAFKAYTSEYGTAPMSLTASGKSFTIEIDVDSKISLKDFIDTILSDSLTKFKKDHLGTITSRGAMYMNDEFYKLEKEAIDCYEKYAYNIFKVTRGNQKLYALIGSEKGKSETPRFKALKGVGGLSTFNPDFSKVFKTEGKSLGLTDHYKMFSLIVESSKDETLKANYKTLTSKIAESRLRHGLADGQFYSNLKKEGRNKLIATDPSKNKELKVIEETGAKRPRFIAVNYKEKVEYLNKNEINNPEKTKKFYNNVKMLNNEKVFNMCKDLSSDLNNFETEKTTNKVNNHIRIIKTQYDIAERKIKGKVELINSGDKNKKAIVKMEC